MKKFLAIILAVMLCVSLLAACPPADEGTSSTEAPKNEPVEIRSVGMFGGNDASAGVYKDMVEKFQEDNDYITVKDESATADDAWKAQVVGDCNAGNEPDVLFFFTDATADPIYNKFVDIETIKEEYPEYGSNIKESAWDFVTAPDGKTYAVPVRGFWEGMFVNEDLFTANSLAVPTDWTSFEAAINGFAKTDIVPAAVALGDVPHYWIEHLILAYGGYDAIQAAKTIGADTAKIPQSWKDAFGAFKTLADMKAFPKNTASTKDADTGALFQAKKAAMQIDGSWYCGNVTQADTTTVVAFPSKTAKTQDTVVAGFSSGFYISKKAWDDEKKRDAAVKFAMAATSNEAIAAYCQVAGSSPAEGVEIDASKLSKMVAAGNDMAAKAAKVTAPTDTWLKADCNTTLRKGANDIAAGKAQVDKVLTDAIAANV